MFADFGLRSLICDLIASAMYRERPERDAPGNMPFSASQNMKHFAEKRKKSMISNGPSSKQASESLTIMLITFQITREL